MRFARRRNGRVIVMACCWLRSTAELEPFVRDDRSLARQFAQTAEALNVLNAKCRKVLPRGWRRSNVRVTAGCS
jgi:hypothetical protein